MVHARFDSWIANLTIFHPLPFYHHYHHMCSAVTVAVTRCRRRVITCKHITHYTVLCECYFTTRKKVYHTVPLTLSIPSTTLHYRLLLIWLGGVTLHSAKKKKKIWACILIVSLKGDIFHKRESFYCMNFPIWGLKLWGVMPNQITDTCNKLLMNVGISPPSVFKIKQSVYTTMKSLYYMTMNSWISLCYADSCNKLNIYSVTHYCHLKYGIKKIMDFVSFDVIILPSIVYASWMQDCSDTYLGH